MFNGLVRRRTLILALLTLAIVVFVITTLQYDFYQDDAYITYRYVENYLHGHGLVFNAGERIEGYTNFGWLVYLLLWGAVGVNYLVVSKATGIFFGAAVVFVTYLLAFHETGERKHWYVLIPTALVAFNLSLAYWAQAGLETAAFVFIAGFSLYLFIRRSWMLIAALTFAVMIRPEGALLAGLYLVIEAILERGWPRFSLRCVAAAFVLSLPLVAFKLAYYHSLLPNPFYAKTGFDLAQLQAGLDYVWRFFLDYPYFPLALVLSILLWRRFSAGARTLTLFVLLYTCYLVLIGGDVLKVHRFFLPLIGPAAVLLGVELMTLVSAWHARTQMLVGVLVLLVLVASVRTLPRGYVTRYEVLEKALTHKMAFLGRQMRRCDRTDFTAAASTIGVFSYELMDHRIIDMLGLTDSTIARHPEPPLEGMESSWKERSHNTRYLLTIAPDYMVFSTGLKPSAPAERALFVYPAFLDSYRGATWYYVPPGQVSGGEIPVYHKYREPQPPFEQKYPIEFVNEYNMGINAYNAGRYVESMQHFQAVAKISGPPLYPYLVFRMARTSIKLKRYEDGERLLNETLAIDSAVPEAHTDLYVYEFVRGNLEKAAIHRKWMEKLIPWEVPLYDSTVVARTRAYRNNQPKN